MVTGEEGGTCWSCAEISIDAGGGVAPSLSSNDVTLVKRIQDVCNDYETLSEIIQPSL